jgi:mono/diheme cytochrome c family protein
MNRALLLLLLVAGTAAARAEPPLTGKQVFDRHCIHCHAPGPEHPGTRQLGFTRGEDNAVLEQRSDLAAEYIRHVVRHGLRSMPAFVPSDLTETQLESLTEYLSRR